MWLRWRIDEATARCRVDQLGKAVDVQAAHCVLAMLADGEGTYPEFARDLLAGETNSDEPRDVDFARSENGMIAG